MELLLTSALIVLLAGGIAWSLARRRRHQRSVADVRQALADCALLQRLVQAMQQHRGMSSAWLSGDASFARRLSERQREIDALLADFLHVAERENDMPWPCLTRNDAAAFRFHWQQMVGGLAQLTPEQSIARHSQQIAQLLGWLAALGEARVELAATGIDGNQARNYANRLPALAECLGQARALGSSAAAAGTCAPVGRVRLLFLSARAETLLGQAQQADAVMRGGAVGRAVAAVQTQLATIRAAILEGTSITVSAASYFEVATTAIDAIYAWMEECGGGLGRALDETGAATTGDYAVGLATSTRLRPPALAR